MAILESTSFDNPLQDATRMNRAADPCILVIFGATGDLTSRKLLPALYNLDHNGQLPAHFACVGFARRDKSNDDFRKEMFSAVKQFSRTTPSEGDAWEDFSEQIYYHQSEFDNDEGYDSLNSFLKELDQKYGTKGNRVYYLSTQPSFFPLIIEKLHQHNLVY